MKTDYLPALFYEMQKLADPHFYDAMTHDEAAGLSLFETDDQIILEAPIPGVKADQILISIEKGIVWIKAENKAEKKDGKIHFQTDRCYSYRVPLPIRIDEHAPPEAVCKDGILTVTLPKSQSSKPIKIAVKEA